MSRLRAELPTFERIVRGFARSLHRWRYVLLCVALVCSAGALGWAVWTKQHVALLGWIRGETFYRGLPCSHWRVLLQSDGQGDQLTHETLVVFHDPSAFEVLAELTRDPDPEVRWPAVRLLRFCGGLPEKIAAVLTERLGDPEPDVLLPSIDGLGDLEVFALPAVPALKTLAGSADELVSASACRALWRIDEEAAIQAGGWRRLEFDSAGFAVTLPGTPEEITASISTKFGDVPITRYRVWHSIAEWNVGVSEYDAAVPETFSDTERFEAASQLVSSALGAELVSSREVERNGFRGRDYTLRAERHGEMFVLRCRTFLAGRRAFQATVAFLEGLVSENAVNYFLESLEPFPPERSDELETSPSR